MNAEERISRLRAALAANDRETAYELLVDTTHDSDADGGAAHGLAGTIAFDLGRREAARRHLERAAELSACDAEACARLAFLVSSEDPRRALALLERHETGLPTWVEPLRARLLVDQRGDVTGALRHLMSALATLPEDDRGSWLSEAARLASRAESADDARHLTDLCKQALEAGRTTGVLDALVHLSTWDGVAHEAIGRAVDALLAQVEPTLEGSTERFRHAMARARRALGSYSPKGAYEWALRALAEKPDDATAALFALEMRILSGDLDGSLSDVGDRAGDVSIREATWMSLTDLLRRHERHDEAADLLETVLESRPTLAGLWIELSRFLTDLGRDSDAVEAFSRAMALDPDIDSQATRLHAGVRQIVDGLPALFQTACGQEATTIHTMRFGHNAVVAAVETEVDHWYAKVFMPGRRSQAQVAETSVLMAQIGERLQGLAVPQPATTAPLSCQALPALVMSRIPGGSLRRSLTHPRSTMTTAHAASAGGALAKLHTVTSTLRDFRRTERPKMGSALSDVVREHRGGWPALRMGSLLARNAPRMAAQALAVVEPIAERALEHIEALERGVIHGDFGWHNLTWSEGRAVGILDFDYAVQDYLLSDLLNGVHRTAFDWFQLVGTGHPNPRPELARAMLSAYFDTRRVSPPSREALDALFVAIRIPYYLHLANAAVVQQDQPAPQTYGRARNTLEILVQQIRWLERAGGLGQLLD